MARELKNGQKSVADTDKEMASLLKKARTHARTHARTPALARAYAPKVGEPVPEGLIDRNNAHTQRTRTHART